MTKRCPHCGRDIHLTREQRSALASKAAETRWKAVREAKARAQADGNKRVAS